MLISHSIVGRSLTLRNVRLNDAAFILALRCDPVLGRHLSPTQPDVAAQQQWISQHALLPDEYYFLIEDRSRTRLGTTRIYEIRGSSFCWGSWVLARHAPRSASIESMLLSFDYGFFDLGLKRGWMNVATGNRRAIGIYRKFGAKLTHSDDRYVYFEVTREQYHPIRQRYQRFLV